METLPLANDAIKACCSTLYEHDWTRLLLGDSFHPGGLPLTERVGALLDLAPETHLVDVASGAGASAVHVAQHFGCTVTGLDYGAQNVTAATARAVAAGVEGRVRFVHGDAEAAPLESSKYDAVLCECALCTFPNKPSAAAEFYRLLRPGGKVGLSDVTQEGPLPPELDTLLAWVACVGDARPAADYARILEQSGLRIRTVESHPEALRELVQQVQARLLAADLMAKLGKVTLPPSVNIGDAQALAKAVLSAVRDGALGYVVIVAEKPDAAP